MLGGQRVDLRLVLAGAVEIGDPPAIDDPVEPDSKLADRGAVERRLDRREHHRHRLVFDLLGRHPQGDPSRDIVEMAITEDRERRLRAVGAAGVGRLADVVDELIGAEPLQLSFAQAVEIVVGHVLVR